MICEELLGLLYGSIVNQVMANSEHLPETNERLEKIGYRIGTKIIDEFMRDSSQKPCSKMKELADKFCTVGVKRFLNPFDCRCEQFRLKDSGCEFNLRIVGNPLLNYVQMPTSLKSGNLQYQAIIKGTIRGAFQVLKLKANIALIFQNSKGDKNECIFFIQLQKDLEKRAD